MFSIQTTRNNVPESIMALLSQAATGVIKAHEDDLNVHDIAFLKRWNGVKNLIEQQTEDEERVFWSVGSHGTHIGIMKSPMDRPWMNIDIYAAYTHYQVWFSITEDDVITAQLIEVE